MRECPVARQRPLLASYSNPPPVTASRAPPGPVLVAPRERNTCGLRGATANASRLGPGHREFDPSATRTAPWTLCARACVRVVSLEPPGDRDGAT